MRSVRWMLPLVLLLVTGSALAQVTPPAFQIAVSPTSSTVVAGNSTQIDIQATRTCPNSAMILDEQVADLTIQHQPDVAVASVGQVVFRSQTCATQQVQTLVVAASVAIPLDYNGTELLDFRIVLQPHPTSSPTIGSSGEEASVTYVIRVERASAMATVASEAEPTLEAPAVPAILLAVALLGGAFALRRR